MAADGVLLTLFAINRNLAVALILFALFGAISTGIQINLATFLQRETPVEKRGRVFGWLSPLFGPVTLLSVLAGPVVAGWVGVVVVLAAAGACEVLLGVAGALSAPRPDRLAEGAKAREPGEFANAAEPPDNELNAMTGEA